MKAALTKCLSFLQWLGHSLLCNSASTLAVSMTEDTTMNTKKNMLKVHGAIWAFTAAHTLYNAQEGFQKKDVSYASAAGQAALSALCFWKGFEE